MYSYEDAVIYFDTEVLHNSAWIDSDESTRKRALKSAESVLYDFYGRKFNRTVKPVPAKAVYEQALWMLRQDDSIQKSELGVTNMNIEGLSVSISRQASAIAPTVMRMLGRKVGRYR